MTMESLQVGGVNTVRHGGMFEEMQREDFLALAAALRQFNAYQPLVSVAEPAPCFGREAHLVLAME